MAQKVVKLGLKREPGYLYYVDKEGDVSMVKMARGKKKGGNPQKIAKCGIERKEGYLYFIDKEGDVSMVKMARKKKR